MIKFISNALVLIVVFQTFNDNLFVDYFGPNSLKISIAIFSLYFVKYIFTLPIFTPINRNVLLFCLAMTLCSVVNYNQLFFPVESLTTPFIILVYFSVFTQYKDIKWLIFTIFFSLLISSFYCLIREDFISELSFRKTGGTGDSNEFSVGLLFGLGLLWGLYLKNKKHLLGVLFFTLFFLSSLLAAGSKSAFIAFMMLMLMFIVYLMKNKSLVKTIKLILSISLFFSIGLYTLHYLYEDELGLFLLRFESSRTADIRIDNWSKGYNIFLDNWLFGIGTNNYQPLMQFKYKVVTEGASAAHNMYLKVLYELGVLGFIPFIFVFKDILKRIISNKRNYIIALISVSYLLMGLSLSLSFEKYVWLIIALCFNNHFINFFKTTSKYEDSTIYSRS